MKMIIRVVTQLEIREFREKSGKTIFDEKVKETSGKMSRKMLTSHVFLPYFESYQCYILLYC